MIDPIEYVKVERTVDVSGQPYITKDYGDHHTFAPETAAVRLSRHGDGSVDASVTVAGARILTNGTVGKAQHTESYWRCRSMPEWLAAIVRTPTPTTMALGWDLGGIE